MIMGLRETTQPPTLAGSRTSRQGGSRSPSSSPRPLPRSQGREAQAGGNGGSIPSSFPAIRAGRSRRSGRGNGVARAIGLEQGATVSPLLPPVSSTPTNLKGE